MPIAIQNYVRITNARSSMSKPAAMVSGHSELGAPALHKAVWWGMHLASLLMHLFVSLHSYGFLSG